LGCDVLKRGIQAKSQDVSRPKAQSSEERYRPEMLKKVEQFDVATSQSILQIYHFAKEEYA
jgi:hypothetical protein